MRYLRRFDAPYASMVHDFAVTQGHVIMPVMPLTASRARAKAGLPFYAWEPERGGFIGVMRRDHEDPVTWWRGPEGFIFHVANSWEDDHCIHIDVMQFDAPPGFPRPDGSPIEEAGHARLCRWTLDRRDPAQRVQVHRISDVMGEFPRIDDRLIGMPYRHCWVAAHGADESEIFSRISHVDHMQPDQADSYVLPVGERGTKTGSDVASPTGRRWVDSRGCGTWRTQVE